MQEAVKVHIDSCWFILQPTAATLLTYYIIIIHPDLWKCGSSLPGHSLWLLHIFGPLSVWGFVYLWVNLSVRCQTTESAKVIILLFQGSPVFLNKSILTSYKCLNVSLSLEVVAAPAYSFTLKKRWSGSKSKFQMQSWLNLYLKLQGQECLTKNDQLLWEWSF